MASNEYIYANLSTREATGSTGSPVNFKWVAGQSVSYAVRFLQRDSAGALSETALPILNLRAAVGREGASPESGWYKIKVGNAPSSASNTTGRLDWNADPMEVEAALNSLPARPADFICDQGDAGLVLRLVDEGPVSLSVIPEGLRPTAYGKVLGGRRFPEKKARVSIGALTFIAKAVGELGNAVSVQYVAPSAGQPLLVTVAGSKITVRLSENTAAAAIKGAIETHTAANELVVVALGDGSSNPSAQPEVFLAGGVNPSGHEYEIKLEQAPVVFTDWTTRKLPPSPTITKIQAGGRSGFPPVIWNTIQALAVPTDFEGAYQFQRTSKQKRSSLASKADGINALTTILNNLLADEGATVKVTNPNNNVAHIEFTGAFAGYDVEDLDISVYSAPPPDYVFTLDLNNADLAHMLQSRESVTLPFEVDVTTWVDPKDPTQGTTQIKLWKTNATITRNMLWDGAAVRPPINWQRQPSPVDYVPFAATQVLTGQQAAYTAVIGGGTDFVIDHNLGGNGGGVVAVAVRENKDDGRQLQDNEYTLRFLSPNSISLQFTASYAANSLVVVVIGYGEESVFTAHTHPIDQIKTVSEGGHVAESLRIILEDFTRRIGRLEALLPRDNVLGLPSGKEKRKVQIPPVGEILPDITLEGSEGDTVSLASQVVGSQSKNTPPAVVSGTDLDEQKKAMEAEILRVKAEAAAQVAAVQAAAAKAAEEVKAQAIQEAEQKKTNVISKIAIQQFGTITETTTNQTSTTTTSTGTTTTVTPVTVKTKGPIMYPALRNGKYPMLLPAIHSAAALDIASVPTVATAAGIVYRNTGTVPLSLPAGGGRKAQSVPVSGYFGGDGRAIYALRRVGETTSYHPIEMERDLMRVGVRASQFPTGSELALAWSLDLSFSTEVVMGGANYIMLVEATPMPDAAVPATTGVNVGALGTPVLLAAPRIAFSRGVSETRQFALKLRRAIVTEGGQSVLRGTSQYTDYGVDSIGPDIPAGDFLLTVRLAQWDVDDSSPAPTGQVGVFMPETQIIVEQI
jgi:hypothetical protein